MMDFIESKAEQLSAGKMVFFGIPVATSHQKENEMIEMMSFCSRLAMEGVVDFVKSAFYDSDSEVCTIEVDESAEQKDNIHSVIKKAASLTLRQYKLLGVIRQGNVSEWYGRIFDCA